MYIFISAPKHPLPNLIWNRTQPTNGINYDAGTYLTVFFVEQIYCFIACWSSLPVILPQLHYHRPAFHSLIPTNIQHIRNIVYMALIEWTTVWVPLLLTRINLNPSTESNHMPSKVWGEITYPFGEAVEVWERIRNFIPHFIMITCYYR